MTGLSAVVQHDGRASAQADDCVSMLRAMEHRGPASWQNAEGNVAMACCAGGAGVVMVRDGIRVMLDGEVHNRRELEIPQSEDAALAVLCCYQRWGVDGVKRLVGDFAFILHDERQQLLLAARDALGMRPLYFHRDGKQLRIASEAQALLGTGLESRPNRLAVALFIALHFSEEGYTLREEIEALPPGHLLIARDRAIELRRYWTPDPWRRLDVGDEDASAMFAETFQEAVRCRLPRKGELAVMLSGGLDSSSIACQAAALQTKPTALHCSLEGWDCDETSISQAVATKWALPSITISGDGREMKDACRPQTRHADQLYHAAAGSFDALFGQARDAGIGTVMTGFGGDQVADENGGECVDALREGNLREVVSLTGIARQPLSMAPYQRLWRHVRSLVPARLRLATRHLRPRPLPRFLDKKWGKRVIDHVDQLRLRQIDERYPDFSSATMCSLLDQYGIRIGAPQINLRGVLNGVDVAHPFLDRRVFELALSMPSRQRRRDGWRKRKPMLRRAVADMLPDEVASRRDAAEFSSYFRDVYLRHHGKGVAALFDDSRLAELKLINIDEVRSALDAGLPGASTIVHFGLILSMELWLRREWS